MTLAEIFSLLNGITGFNGKVAYRAFKKGMVPALPYICFRFDQTENFKADNKVYHVIQDVDIELYSSEKDTASEALIEAALDGKNIVWDKYETYIESESMYMIIYEVEV